MNQVGHQLVARNGKMEVQRNLHISFRNAYLFVAIPKVANSTIKGILQNQELRGTTFVVDDIHNRLCSPLVAPFQLRPAHFEKILTGPDFFRFLFVRDPFSRLLSCYLDRIQAVKSVPRRQIAEQLGQSVEADISFKQFVYAVSEIAPRDMNEHFRPQKILASPDLIPYDFIGRFENYSSDMKILIEKIWPNRADKIDLSVNLSPKVTDAGALLLQHFSAELEAKVAEIYAADFDEFGYAPELAR